MTKRRMLLPLIAGLVTLAVVAPLAWIRADAEVDEINVATEVEAQWRVRNAMLSLRSDEFQVPGNVWVVNPVDGWANPMGEVWDNPPVLALAEPALDEQTVSRYYDFDGHWLIYGEYAGFDEVIITAVGRDDDLDAIAAARWRWGLVTAAAALAVGLGTWLMLRRSTTPVERAHVVNRDFIADAAHELRTPLSIIQASAGHALAREREPDAYRESLEEILTATERAGSSVGELLEFARLEAGQATPRLAPLRLDLLVEEVASSIRVDDTTIDAVPGDAVVVEADYNLIRQVIDNIARNAAARAENVTLTTHLETREARVEVADDGPGFDPGVIDHVFQRFRRGDRSGSVGLGMAIARTIVELHGGSCEAANRPEGGAVVTIRIPYKPST